MKQVTTKGVKQFIRREDINTIFLSVNGDSTFAVTVLSPLAVTLQSFNYQASKWQCVTGDRYISFLLHGRKRLSS